MRIYQKRSDRLLNQSLISLSTAMILLDEISDDPQLAGDCPLPGLDERQLHP